MGIVRDVVALGLDLVPSSRICFLNLHKKHFKNSDNK